MAHTSDAQRNTYDEPFSLARPMIVGSIAGVLACVGFFNLQGYGGYSADVWNGGTQPAPARQLGTNAVHPERNGTQQAQPDGSYPVTDQGGEQPEQDYAPAEPQQGYAPPQQEYAPPQQEYGPPQQGDARTGSQARGPNGEPVDQQQPYR